MDLSVHFEDRHGLYVISSMLFDIDTKNGNLNIVDIKVGDMLVSIEGGFSAGSIFTHRTEDRDFDKIIVVYDMDGPGGGKQNFLSSGRFNKIVKNNIIKEGILDK